MSRAVSSHFDDVQFHVALRDQVLPALRHLAANDNARNRGLKRFERDAPPPYVSSTESEEFYDSRPVLPADGVLPEELEAIMEPPIDEAEQAAIAYFLQSIQNPGDCYDREARFERRRLNRYISYAPNQIFRGKRGFHRLPIIIRHNIRRRWEKLGVWNPKWGIPGRLNEQPNDRTELWKWRWHCGESDDSGLTDVHLQQLVARALRLRQNLRRGENCPMSPRSHLEQDTSASQAESFIISRPWFTFPIEACEERERFRRIPLERRPLGFSATKQVIKWWKERGDWREQSDLRLTGSTFWKWRHESPSPEPEDLTPIGRMNDSPLDAMDIEFTPSETDALEAIRAPSPVEPARPWQDFPPPTGIFAPLEEQPEEQNEGISRPQRRNSSSPLQTPGRQRHRQPRRKADLVMCQHVPLRRSARIAALRSAEPSSSQAGLIENVSGGATPQSQPPVAQTRETRRSIQTRPVPAGLPLKQKSQPKRRESGPSKPSAATKK